jgi:hypothetical protein
MTSCLNYAENYNPANVLTALDSSAPAEAQKQLVGIPNGLGNAAAKKGLE